VTVTERKEGRTRAVQKEGGNAGKMGKNSGFGTGANQWGIGVTIPNNLVPSETGGKGPPKGKKMVSNRPGKNIVAEKSVRVVTLIQENTITEMESKLPHSKTQLSTKNARLRVGERDASKGTKQFPGSPRHRKDRGCWRGVGEYKRSAGRDTCP